MNRYLNQYSILLILAVLSNASLAITFDEVEKINWEINKIRYVSDENAYGKKDHWATPEETKTNGFGDCEDYAIAKYFALIKTGVDVDQLKIAYVESKIGPHMILLYLDEKNTEWVLDNMYRRVLKLTHRKDLKEIYRFNGEGLYLADGTLLSNNLPQWVDLLSRITSG